MPDTGHRKGEGMSESIFDRSILSGEAVKLLDVLLRHANEIGEHAVVESLEAISEPTVVH